MKPTLERYLGDGLYISIERDMIKLRAPRDGVDHLVYLEGTVLQNFLDYLKANNIITLTPNPISNQRR